MSNRKLRKLYGCMHEWLFGRPLTDVDDYYERLKMCAASNTPPDLISNFWKGIEHLKPENRKTPKEFKIIIKPDNIEIIISEIEKQEIKNKNKLGTAYGIDLGHCVYIANKCDKAFLEKVKWYNIFEKQPDSIKVDFYGD